MKRKSTKSYYNWLSISGFILVVNSLVLILFLFLVSVFSSQSNTYLGIYIYIVLPVFLVLGLILIPIGMWIKIRKRKQGKESAQMWPVLDLNIPRNRHKLVRVSILVVIFLIVSAMGSYQAFQYSESVPFCGEVCHTVMEPEYVTYQNSPHARVACVDCHVGEGADWFVKSKLSGLYQVYAVTVNNYPRPIPTPIKNLRPARETCERCHWPDKFYGHKLRVQRSFLADSANTEWDISLMMKIGPAYSALGLTEGIHWHINPDIQIEYVASTPDRETIPWVRYTNLKTGEVKIYTDQENPPDSVAMDTLMVRSMDCMDCHNRPSHLFHYPSEFVDKLMLTKVINPRIPYIKQAAMMSLKESFTNLDTALNSIQNHIETFYQETAPEVYQEWQPDIVSAILAIQEEYQLNAFPAMHASASSYLNHIGHLESAGCFRCHSNRHATESGEIISKDCDMCHTIVAQGRLDSMMYTQVNDTLPFIHPVDIGEDTWKEYFCSDCHSALY